MNKVQALNFKVALESSKPMISSLKLEFELSKCWNLEHIGQTKPKKWHPLAKIGFLWIGPSRKILKFYLSKNFEYP